MQRTSDLTLTTTAALAQLVGQRQEVLQRGSVNAVAFGLDGRLLASADSDGTVRLWNPANGHAVGRPLLGTGGGANEVAFSPDGRLLASADSDGTVQLWNPATSQQIGSPLLLVTGGSVNAVAFSPDGKRLATADGNGTVQLWTLVFSQTT